MDFYDVASISQPSESYKDEDFYIEDLDADGENPRKLNKLKIEDS